MVPPWVLSLRAKGKFKKTLFTLSWFESWGNATEIARLAECILCAITPEMWDNMRGDVLSLDESIPLSCMKAVLEAK